MSDALHLPPSESTAPRSKASSLLVPLLGFLLFALFSLNIVHEINGGPSDSEKRDAERLKILEDYQKTEAAAIGTGYGWVDSGRKVVRIPIDRAMDLVVAELHDKKVGAAYPIGGSPGGTAAPAAPAPGPAMPAAPASSSQSPAAPTAPAPKAKTP